MSKPKAPKEDASTIALRAQQAADLSRLDEEENLRIKQLLVGQRGGRFFRGAPLLRARPGNKAGGPAGTGAGSAATVSSGGVRSTLASNKKGLYDVGDFAA